MQDHFVDRQPICSDRITIIHIVSTHNARQLWFMILYINTMPHFCENFSSPHQFTKTSYPLFDLLDIPIPFPLPVQCKNYYDHIILFYTSILRNSSHTRKPLKMYVCMCQVISFAEGEEQERLSFVLKRYLPLQSAQQKRKFSCYFLLLPSVENTFPLRSFSLLPYTETLPNVKLVQNFW